MFYLPNQFQCFKLYEGKSHSLCSSDEPVTDIWILYMFYYITVIIEMGVWGHSCLLFSQLFSQNAFGYVLPITSFVVAWLETWFLDFKVLTQEAEDERGEKIRAVLNWHKSVKMKAFDYSCFIEVLYKQVGHKSIFLSWNITYLLMLGLLKLENSRQLMAGHFFPDLSFILFQGKPH